MANKVGTITIEWVTRACEVDGRPGLFHIWEQWLHREPLRGGNSCYSRYCGRSDGAPIGQVYGIVEFSDGVKRVDPVKIKFCDEDNVWLATMEKHKEAEKDDQDH